MNSDMRDIMKWTTEQTRSKFVVLSRLSRIKVNYSMEQIQDLSVWGINAEDLITEILADEIKKTLGNV